MQRYVYHLNRFIDYVQNVTNNTPSNTRDCFNIFFCNEYWCEKMLYDDINYEECINIEINKKGLLECYWKT